ncbi:MAG: hypothetical protein Rubg2KO_24240 [Rubricoccaceae bacterium]
MTEPSPARGVQAATALLLVLGLIASAMYPHVASPKTPIPFPPDAVWSSVERAILPYGLLALAAWGSGGRRLATSAALIGSLLTVGLGLALYAVALGADSPTAPVRALRIVPLRQLAFAAITAYLVYIARRASSQ